MYRLDEAFNAPAAFGGGLDRAEALLKKALDLYGADAPQPPLPAWGRADAHIWLGQVYAKTALLLGSRAAPGFLAAHAAGWAF